MKTMAALVRREFRERRMVLAAAAFAAVMPFVIPIARGLHGAPMREVRESLGVIVAAGFAVVLALALGWSVLSRDLADRRLGFYLSRPIPAAALWAGKLGAAWLLALAAAAVVWLPSWLVSGGTTVLVTLPKWWVWALIGTAAILVVASHAAAIAMRSRSALLIVDFAAVILAAAGALFLTRFLLRRSALWPLRAGLIAVAALLILGLLAGGLAAITRGRGDIRSAHRALSPWIWGGLAAGLAAYGGLAAWVLSARPADLFLAGAQAAPRGTWIAVSGQAHHVPAGFLLDTESGRFLAAGCVRPGGENWWSAEWWTGPSFSADGGTAAWFEPAGIEAPFELVTASLASGKVRKHSSGFTSTIPPIDIAVSPDGERVALLRVGGVEIVETATGRSLVSARLGNANPVGAFIDSDRFLGAIQSEHELALFDLDVASRRLTPRASVRDLVGWYAFWVDRSGDRVIIREKSGKRVRLFDARAGSPIATLAEGPLTSSWAGFLGDDRIVLLAAGDSGASLRLFDAVGRLLKTIPIPRKRLLLGGEVAPGKIVFSTRSGDFESAQLYLADVDSGEVRRVADDLFPVAWYQSWRESGASGAEATKLFYTTAPVRGLVHFDPLTGERRTILKGVPGD